MRSLSFAFVWLVGISGSPAEVLFEKGFYKVLGSQDERWREIEKAISGSDISISTSENGKLDLGIISDEKSEGGKPLLFTAAQLEGFFRNQNNKKMVLITVAKNDMVSDNDKLSIFFKKMGYRRVLILRSHSSGYLVVSDRIVNQEKQQPSK